MSSIIKVEGLKKSYRVLNRREGLTGAIKDLVSRNYSIVDAVDNISFLIEEGEIIGFLGPNGAGKSTTIKMMIGVLKPSAGICDINGYNPFLQRKKYVKEIGIVIGQRTQLWWDLPVIESYKLLKEIYSISNEDYKKNLAVFEDILELNKLYMKPVRSLSLGQRILCDIAASFLHNPKIIFLDEPTIGLDVSIKACVRNLIKELNQLRKTTIVLTSHDVGDIESLSSRIILIDKGKLLFDGQTQKFVEVFGNYKTINFMLTNSFDATEEEIRRLILNHFTSFDINAVIQRENNDWFSLCFDAEKIEVTLMVEMLLKNLLIKDISIEAIQMEEIIRRMYEGELN